MLMPMFHPIISSSLEKPLRITHHNPCISNFPTIRISCIKVQFYPSWKQVWPLLGLGSEIRWSDFDYCIWPVTLYISSMSYSLSIDRKRCWSTTNLVWKLFFRFRNFLGQIILRFLNWVSFGQYSVNVFLQSQPSHLIPLLKLVCGR